MGKGDKRSRRGKITIKSFGKTRLRRKKKGKPEVKSGDKAGK
jgi:ribosomal small subunit protein bTHX